MTRRDLRDFALLAALIIGGSFLIAGAGAVAGVTEAQLEAGFLVALAAGLCVVLPVVLMIRGAR